jgi:Leucine-rich repeat (LRR) protein
LQCSGNKLTNLDVSGNTQLICLNCQENQLSELHVRKNKRLQILNCSGNRLTDLDVRYAGNYFPLTEKQEAIIKELREKGFSYDVISPYKEQCMKRNRAEYVLKKKTKAGIYKEGAESGMTGEERDKFEKLIEMGWKDVAGVWMDFCNTENETPEWEARRILGLFAADITRKINQNII